YPYAELAVDAFPEAVAQPGAGLLVGAQRAAQLLLRLDQQLLVDDRRQDRAGQQVADVVAAPLEDPLLGDVLPYLQHVVAVGAELAVALRGGVQRRGDRRGRHAAGGHRDGRADGPGRRLDRRGAPREDLRRRRDGAGPLRRGVL